MTLGDLVVPGFVSALGLGVLFLGRWMILRPERLEDAVWPNPNPVEKRDLVSTRQAGSWLVFLGPFLAFMVTAIAILPELPASVRNNVATFPIVLIASGFGAYFLRRRIVSAASPEKRA